MSDLVSYLLAQARYRPVATAQFAVGELWRRGRLRLSNSLDSRLPEFDAETVRARLRLFLPAGARQLDGFTPAYPQAAEATLAEADAVLRHEFSIFGERMRAGAEIDWLRDWQSGHRWPLAQNGKLKIVGAAPGADVKRPWELARFHHALALGRAYSFTRDARFADEFAAQVRHFLRENPYPRGIHWAMPMEAAIRAVNWTTAAAFFADALDANFWRDLANTLFQHGRFVAAHREWNPVARGNHYLSCVAGMLFLGLLFEENCEARGWLEFARTELVREMFAQVREDGVAHEGSSGYHAFLTELLLSSALLIARYDARAQGNAFDARAAIERSCGAAFVARLEKMFSFLAALVAGRERPPIWGDSDDGRLLPLCTAPGSAAEHLLAVGRVLFGRDDWPAGCPACEEVWWRFGPEISDLKFETSNEGRTDLAARTSVVGQRTQTSRGQWESFPHSGFFFFSSRRMRGSVRCGPLGVNGWTNHAHCDQLSLEFCWDGKPVVVDPGSFVYSSDAEGRNLFRSTRYHNSPLVNGEEQNRYWPGLLFRIVDDTRSRVLRCDFREERIEFRGEHLGYHRLPERIRVERQLTLDRGNDALRVCDVLRGSGRVRMEWHWHFAPDAELSRLEDTSAKAPPLNALGNGKSEAVIVRGAWRAGPVTLRVWMPAAWDCVAYTEERGWVAPGYGRRVEAPVLRVSAESELPGNVAFTFEES